MNKLKGKVFWNWKRWCHNLIRIISFNSRLSYAIWKGYIYVQWTITVYCICLLHVGKHFASWNDCEWLRMRGLMFQRLVITIMWKDFELESIGIKWIRPNSFVMYIHKHRSEGRQSSMILYTCVTKHFQNNPLTSLALYQKTTPKQVLAQF